MSEHVAKWVSCKFLDSCEDCGKEIEYTERCYWVKGEGIYCETCGEVRERDTPISERSK